MSNLRQQILTALKHSERLTPSELHRSLNGRYATQDIESEMIAMDMDGVIVNDLVPMAKITQKGRKERGAVDAG
jgi:hypothetical protein